jgi:hypothetical protein
MKRYIIPLALAQAADVLSTWLSLSFGGYEANPVAKFLLAAGGLPLLAFSKVIIVFIAILAMQNALKYKDRLLIATKFVINGITVLTFLVSAWNILVAVVAWKLS